MWLLYNEEVRTGVLRFPVKYDIPSILKGTRVDCNLDIGGAYRMIAKAMSWRGIWRAGLIGLAVVAVALVAGLSLARAQQPQCPPGQVWDSDLGMCVPIEPPDCGPNPYLYNDVGGHWQRKFNHWCFFTTNDPFEAIFHNMTYAEAQAEMAGLGLAGLSREQQLQAFIQMGYWSETEGYMPLPRASDEKIKTAKEADCGQNPYVYNDVGGHFERQFAAFCYPITEDPNELDYDGLWLNETPLVQ